MSEYVPLEVQGRYEEVVDMLRALKQHVGARNCAVWSPPRWEQGPGEEVREQFEVEVLDAIKRADAWDRVRRAVDAIDPDRDILKGGGIDWEPVK